MHEPISADEAIQKGQRIVNYPVIAISIGTFGLGIYFFNKEIIPGWGILISIVVAFLLSWLWWSIMITRWRLWAFDKVRNVHELKRKAIQELLIWKDNNFFEKTEIRTAKQAEKWILLQKKFELEDVFYDDLSVPEVVVIYYSKWSKYTMGFIVLFGILIGIYMFLKYNINDYYLGILLPVVSAIGSYFNFLYYKKIADSNPQIILNNEGIETISTKFYNWDDISDESIEIRGSGNTISYHLAYNHPEGTEYLKINDYDISKKKLEKLLTVYRARNNQKHNPQQN